MPPIDGGGARGGSTLLEDSVYADAGRREMLEEVLALGFGGGGRGLDAGKDA